MTAIIDQKNFEETLKTNNQPILIDFFAEWCGPCKALSPTIDELSKEYEGKAVVGKLNIDENPELAARFGVRSIPTLLIFKGGEVVDKLAGLVPKKLIAEKIANQI